MLTVRWLRRQPAGDQGAAAGLTEAANTMLLALLPIMELVSVAPPFEAAWPDLRDHYDQPRWTAARRAGASFVISHDVDDFPPRDREGWCRHTGIEYITAEIFLRQVARLNPEDLLQTRLPDGRVRHERQGR